MRVLLLAFVAALVPATALARDVNVDPSTLNASLSGLAPGDVVHLASGDYQHFTLSGVVGTAPMPIVVEGPADGSAVVHADTGPCCNTVQIDGDVAYVVIRNLTIDGGGVDGAFGVAARGTNVHHVTIEGCTFLHHDAGQQTDAISTKTPTFGWVIRGNRILSAGTGMYLGNSTGDDPFVGGVIENNLIYDTVGYNIEIKWQLPRGTVAGWDGSDATTIIRHNVFLKTDRASPDGDRPNLLVGGFPDSGPGANDTYQIYGNVFAHNPRESLLQVSGRVSIHDNVFFDTPNTAIRLQDHDLPLRRAWVYDNTISVDGSGIAFGDAASDESIVAGNLVIAGSPITGTITTRYNNLVNTPDQAAMYFVMPGTTLGSVDFYPNAGQAIGGTTDHAPFASDLDYDADFNCAPRAPDEYLGAYAGDPPNPGWRIAMEVKPPCGAAPPPTDGGVPGPDAGAGTDAGPRDASMSGDAATAADAGSGGGGGGCCSAAGTHDAPGPLLVVVAIAVI